LSGDAVDADRSEPSQVERAYQSIKTGIIIGRYRPGAPLSEVMLAREHGMSRTPVREGLARLWQERYLERVSGHGYFVARVTVQSIHDTFDVRRLLEGAAAARAAELASPAEIAELRRLAPIPPHPPGGAPPPTVDYREAERANARFHLAIARAARNTLAAELIERCLAQVDRFMSLGLQFGPFQEGAAAAHLEIVDAIERRDPAGAQARMEQHLDCGSQRMKELLLQGQLAAIGVE
jgi:DNA-binding GntR family transcriptional regulator